MAGDPNGEHVGSGSSTGHRSGLATLGALSHLLSAPEQPGWFDVASGAVLAGADAVLAAGGPRELEQATVDMLGAQLRAAAREDRGGSWFDWWFEELIGVLAGRVEEELAAGGQGWRAPWWLLHGLTSIGLPGLADVARRRVQALSGRVAAACRRDPGVPGQPAWLAKMPRVSATGEIWELRDVYGSRFGIVAGYTYPDSLDASVFLFDIDACGMVDLAGAGCFDDLAHAAAAWRTAVGDAGADAELRPVPDPWQLECMVHWESSEMLTGWESDSVLDNWFRGRRRCRDLDLVLKKRRTPLPPARSLYHDVDTGSAVRAFTAWYAARHGTAPDHEAVEALAEEWLKGCLPGTEHATSPHRIRYQRTLIGDWISDDPITLTVKALLPDWVRWHAEQNGLPDHLTRNAVALAAGEPPQTPDCGPETM